MPEIRLEVESGVATVTISHPEARNGLTPEMSNDLITACEEIDNRAEIGAAIIRGDNATFCSGADTRLWGPDVEWAAEGFDMLSAVYSGFARVGQIAVPTIAAVRGAAVGAGVNLMLACDVRIVAEEARIITGFLSIGLHPGGGFFTLLSRAAGREATAAMGLFGAEVRGSDAVSRGLAWEAVGDSDVEDRARDLAFVAARDPLISRRATATMRAELGPPAVSWAAAVEMERGRQMWSMYRRLHSR